MIRLLTFPSLRSSGRRIRELAPTDWFVALFVILLGITLRFLVALRGNNFDFESYLIVTEAAKAGLNPWDTGRYNYGPLWFYILQISDAASFDSRDVFRYLIILVLIGADLMISYFVLRTRSLILACVFFLNPVSIIITGYHNQFDNVAIATICLGILIYRKENSSRKLTQEFLLLLLLGLSLSFKHVFLFFPLWLLFRERSLLKRVVFLVVPLIIFTAGFLPYLHESFGTIKMSVLDYRSITNAPLLNSIPVLEKLVPDRATVFFASAMILIGLSTRKRPLSEAFYLYCVAMLVFSPAVHNQYLVVGAVGAVGIYSVFSIFYFLWAILFLLIDYSGPGIISQDHWLSSVVLGNYAPFCWVLLAGLIFEAIARENRDSVDIS